MSVRSSLALLGAWTAVGAAGALGLVLGAPRLVGGRAFTVLSGSMAPALRVGDLTVGHPVRAARARPGDVVTFRDPFRADRLITHRVQSASRTGGEVAFVTRGDANTGVERWSIAADGTVVRIALRVPRVGAVLERARSTQGWTLLVLVPVLALTLGVLRRIWRPVPTARTG